MSRQGKRKFLDLNYDAEDFQQKRDEYERKRESCLLNFILARRPFYEKVFLSFLRPLRSAREMRAVKVYGV